MMFKLNPYERLLIESGINHYKLIGPGLIWLRPWQKVLTRLYVGPQERALRFEGIRTLENVPVKVTVEVLYQVDPVLLTDGLLPKIPGLSQGGWSGMLQWRTEQVSRRMLAGHSWREFGRQALYHRLERHLTQTLADYLKGIGLRITSVCLVSTELPDNLQSTIVQAEQDSLEPRGRALVLKEYADIFGGRLSQAMPYIVQWELLSLLHKNGQPQLFLTSSDLSLDGRSANGRVTQPTFQMQLPL